MNTQKDMELLAHLCDAMVSNLHETHRQSINRYQKKRDKSFEIISDCGTYKTKFYWPDRRTLMVEMRDVSTNERFFIGIIKPSKPINQRCKFPSVIDSHNPAFDQLLTMAQDMAA